MDAGDLRHALARGLVCGLVGTAAMTAAQGLATRLQSSGDERSSGGGEEPKSDEQRWNEAPAPAQVGRRLSLRVLGRDLPADRIGLITNVMHWSYGTGWGTLYGALTERLRTRPLAIGVAFGTAVWAMSYVELVPMGIYEPPWSYAPRELAQDYSYHLAYGAGLGTADAVLPRG